MIVKGCKGDEYSFISIIMSDEEEEAEEEIQKKKTKQGKLRWLYAGAFLQSLSLNFFAEWGDTSQVRVFHSFIFR